MTTPPGYTDKYGRLWQGPFPFTRDAVTQRAPAVTGVYQVLYAGEHGPVVAYIGIATGRNTIAKRLRAHVSERGNWALGTLSEVDRFSFVFFGCDEQSARQIESHVLSTEKP